MIFQILESFLRERGSFLMFICMMFIQTRLRERGEEDGGTFFDVVAVILAGENLERYIL